VGFGTFHMKNTSVTSYGMISLRPDYGTFWDGDIIIEDCRFVKTGDFGRGHLIGSFAGGKYYGGVDFGYPSMLPRNVTIKNLVVENIDELQIFLDFLHEEYNPGNNNEYALGAPESVVVSGINGVPPGKVRLSGSSEPSYTKLFKDVNFRVTN